eukprot:scaffold407_cov130-Isochrysis_galbana.AAC.4
MASFPQTSSLRVGSRTMDETIGRIARFSQPPADSYKDSSASRTSSSDGAGSSSSSSSSSPVTTDEPEPAVRGETKGSSWLGPPGSVAPRRASGSSDGASESDETAFSSRTWSISLSSSSCSSEAAPLPLALPHPGSPLAPPTPGSADGCGPACIGGGWAARVPPNDPYGSAFAFGTSSSSFGQPVSVSESSPSPSSSSHRCRCCLRPSVAARTSCMSSRCICTDSRSISRSSTSSEEGLGMALSCCRTCDPPGPRRSAAAEAANSRSSAAFCASRARRRVCLAATVRASPSSLTTLFTAGAGATFGCASKPRICCSTSLSWILSSASRASASAAAAIQAAARGAASRWRQRVTAVPCRGRRWQGRAQNCLRSLLSLC